MLKKENQKEKKIMKELLVSKVEDITTEIEEQSEVNPVVLNQTDVSKVDETHIKIENQIYEVVVDYREAFQVEAISKRYNTILNKYDYIVGDWGYDQLRLKGFFDESNNRAPFDKKIDFLEDYLFEYCNFGCAYFVLEKEKSEKSKKSKSQRKKKPKRTESPNTETKKTETRMDRSKRKESMSPAPKKKPQQKSVATENDKKATPNNQNKDFVIKKSENKKPYTQVKDNKTNPANQQKPKTDFKIHTTKEEK